MTRAGAAAVLLAMALSACGGGTTASGPEGGPQATPMPRATALAVTAGPGIALTGDPKKWYTGALTAVSLPARAPAWELDGTGRPGTAADLFSPALPVQAGKRYVFSLWVDPTHLSAGSVIVGIYNLKRNVQYAQARITRGAAGRYAVRGIIPSGVHSVVVDFQPNFSTIEAGAKLIVAQPAFGPDAR